MGLLFRLGHDGTNCATFWASLTSNLQMNFFIIEECSIWTESVYIPTRSHSFNLLYVLIIQIVCKSCCVFLNPSIHLPPIFFMSIDFIILPFIFFPFFHSFPSIYIHSIHQGLLLIVLWQSTFTQQWLSALIFCFKLFMVTMNSIEVHCSISWSFLQHITIHTVHLLNIIRK